jgi:hypothetical protein
MQTRSSHRSYRSGGKSHGEASGGGSGSRTAATAFGAEGAGAGLAAFNHGGGQLVQDGP